MTLDEALAALDPGVAAHWTKDGLPDLRALTEMVGRRVLRRDVPAGLSRDTANPPVALPVTPVARLAPTPPGAPSAPTRSASPQEKAYEAALEFRRAVNEIPAADRDPEMVFLVSSIEVALPGIRERLERVKRRAS